MRRQLKIQRPATLPEPMPMMRPSACRHCPSTNYPPDPECLDIRAAPKQERLETAFACGWDKRFYCRGYCLYMDIGNDDLKRLQGLEGQDQLNKESI